MRRVVLTLFLTLCFFFANVAAANGGHRRITDPCANTYCTKDRPGTKSCKNLSGLNRYARGFRLTAERRMVRCYVGRAARHYGVSEAALQYITWHESRWTEVGSNAYGFRGPQQFSLRLWYQAPYSGHGRNEARWSSLAAAWTIRYGSGICNWDYPSYRGRYCG